MAKVTDEWVMQQRQSTWWAGSKDVEPYMPPIAASLNRHLGRGPGWADIYNRAYEAVHKALHDKASRDGEYWRNRALKADLELRRCYKDLEQLTAECADLKSMLADAGVRNDVLQKRLGVVVTVLVEAKECPTKGHYQCAGYGSCEDCWREWIEGSVQP